ncbi:hypothetical protein CFP56_041160 [Quercus suber]|uniref:Uncharacterized protein n=1 Tax=Quercus suber TaxID=58331 RepID=A0AAW0IWH1_QUESU
MGEMFILIESAQIEAEFLTFSIALPSYFLLFYNDFNQNKLRLELGPTTKLITQTRPDQSADATSSKVHSKQGVTNYHEFGQYPWLTSADVAFFHINLTSA